MPSFNLLVSDPSQENILLAEATILSMPVFALTTKGLASVQSFHWKNSLLRFSFCVAHEGRTVCDDKAIHPGPLSRSVHYALLWLLLQQGLPITQSVTWRWRDLCRTMGLSQSGRTVLQLKAALKATAHVVVERKNTTFEFSEEQTVSHDSQRLYEQLVFHGELLPEGGEAMCNELRFASWYVDSVNAGCFVPIDYEVWKSLDYRSSIASRMYELLLLHCRMRQCELKLDYRRLASFLPVKCHPCFSSAKVQLDTSLQMLIEAGIIESAAWLRHPNSVAVIRIVPGPMMLIRQEDAEDIASSLKEFIEQSRLFSL